MSRVAMIEVKSSNIAKVGHDHGANILVIEFHSGQTYEYYDVEREVYKEFMRAKSLGSYFQKNIRNTYRYKKR